MAKAVAPWTDGYYLIPPFARTGLMAGIIRRIRAQDAGEPVPLRSLSPEAEAACRLIDEELLSIMQAP